jgi:hypothetical protein
VALHLFIQQLLVECDAYSTVPYYTRFSFLVSRFNFL